MIKMSYAEVSDFIGDLLENVLPNGLVERIGEFYTQDVIGHYRGESFYFEDIKKRFAEYGKSIDQADFKILDFVINDDFITLIMRQSWRDVAKNKRYDGIVGGVYRMCGDKISELWMLAEIPLEVYTEVNKNFVVAMEPFAIDKKEQERFLRILKQQQNQNGMMDVALTAREKDCLYYYIKGFTAKEIANVIGVSYRTVESYLLNIKSKYGCSTKAQLREIIFSDAQDIV